MEKQSTKHNEGMEFLKEAAKKGDVNEVAQRILRMRGDLVEELDDEVFFPAGRTVSSVLSLKGAELEEFDRELTFIEHSQATEKRGEHFKKMQEILSLEYGE